MKKSTNKQTTFRESILIAAFVVVVIVLTGYLGYYIGTNKHDDGLPLENTPGYITADAARDQVNNFYQQYLNPKKQNPEASRELYISQYGDKNLVFYSKYYKHGFDPIVCSSIMPISVTALRVQPGAGAEVTAEAKYEDGTSANIDLTLVLNNEGFKIDTITCSGIKGNLPPQ